MIDIISFAIGMPLGIFASLVAWWIIYRGYAPKMKFSEVIAKQKNNHSGYKYFIKVENAGKRTIVDAEFFVQLRIRNLTPKSKNLWKVLFIPLEYNHIPRMRSANKYGIRDALSLRIERCDQIDSNIFTEEIVAKHAKGELQLEELMNLGEDADLQLISYGYDEFSGARKVFESKYYKKTDIHLGRFKKASLEFTKDDILLGE